MGTQEGINKKLVFPLLKASLALNGAIPVPSGSAGGQAGILLGSLTWWSFQDGVRASVTLRWYVGGPAAQRLWGTTRGGVRDPAAGSRVH